MGFFSFGNKDNIENENKTKPFHANKNADDQRVWFSRTRPWNKVSPQIIDALIDKFGEDSLFEVFVITSMNLNLVGHYEELGRTELANIPDAVCAKVSGLLCSSGVDAAHKFLQLFPNGGKTKKLNSLYGTAMNCLETSVVLSDLMISSYIQMALLRSAVLKNDEAIKYLDTGLLKINELEESSDVFRYSNIESIASAPKDLDEMKHLMISMRENLAA